MAVAIRRKLGIVVCVVAAAIAAWAQNPITPVAGAAWTFSGSGGPAIQAPLVVGGSHTSRLGVVDAASLAVDAAGDVLLADAGNSLVLKVAPNGTISVLAGNGSKGFGGDGGAATAASLNRPSGVAVDVAGNIYIADNGNNRIRKVNSSGIISTFAGNGRLGNSGDGGPATAASLYDVTRLAVGPDGSVYFNAFHQIRKVTAAGIMLPVGGQSQAGYSGDGGPATLASFSLYSSTGSAGLALDATGNVHIADYFNHRIRKIDTSGIVTTVVGNGLRGFAGDGGAATLASLNYPNGVAFDAAGNLYIADGWNFRVRKVGTDGTITTIAGSGVLGFSGDGGPAISAAMGDPFAVSVDKAGNLYIADSENGRIRKVDAYGIISTIAGNGLYKFSGDGGPATRANLNRPGGAAVDAAGNLYIADTLNNRIRKIAIDGSITTVAGNGVPGFSGDGGRATAASLAWPEGSPAIDNAGNLYLSDTANNRIRRVSPDGIISSFAGRGSAGSSGDGGPAAYAAFNDPAGLALDAAGNLYVADRSNLRVRRIDGRGVITTVAGNGRGFFSGDNGPATAATLYTPNGVAVDAGGNLYIADGVNNRVRKVDAAGIITTVAGNGVSALSGDGGPATGASMKTPTGVAVDFLGNVYIADYEGQSVRKVTPDGTISTIAGYLASGTVTGAALSWPAAVAVDGAGNLFIADSGNDRILYSAGPSAAFRPVINAGGLVNAASYTSPLTPGGIASLFGFNLADSPAVAGLPLPSVLGGVMVKVNGVAAPLFFASPNQINFQVPWEVLGQTQAAITVTAGGLTSLSQTVKLVTSPALFSIDSRGSGQGAILIANSDTVAAPLGSIPGRNTRPAIRAEFLSIFCTGLGDVANRPASGAPPSAAALASTTLTPSVTIGGAPAPVAFSGLAPGFVGLYQVNVQVPDNAPKGDAVPVVVTLGGASSNTVTIAVQ